jgi:hypothetical protein
MRVANRHIHILVRTPDFQTLVPLPLLFVFKRRHMRNDEFLARHSEFDADVKWLAAPMMPMRRLDDHAAARDAVEILVEFGRFLLDPRRHSRGCVHVSEGRLHWLNHDGLVVLSF